MEFKVTFANGRQTYVDADNEKELKSELDKLVKTFGSDVSKVSAMDEKFSIGGFITGTLLGGYFGNEVAKNGLQKTAKKTAKSVVSTSKRTFNKAKKEVAGFKKASTRKYATGGITKQADGTYHHPSGFKIEPYDKGRYILLDPDGMDAVGESMTLAEAKQTLLDNVESGHFKTGGKVKSFPIAIKRKIDEINAMLPKVKDADDVAGGYFGSTHYSYVSLLKPIEIKGQYVYIHPEQGMYYMSFEKRYNVNKVDEEWGGKKHLLSDLAKISKAFKGVLKDDESNQKFMAGGKTEKGGVNAILSTGFYVKINPYYTATIRSLKSFEEYLKRKDEIWGKEFGEITYRDKTASKEWVAGLNELIAQKKAELHEHGSSKYKVGDMISILRNQAERDAEVIAVSGHEILVEYTMPNGTSALNVIDTTINEYRGGSGKRNYEPITYSEIKKSKKWASKINPERLVNNPQSGAKYGTGGGVGKYEYKTISTRSASGLKEAERLKAEGWKIISTGFDTIQFERLKPTKKMSTGGSAGSNTTDMNYNEILAVLKEKLDDAVQELPNDYEQSYDAKGEEVEHQSRDGFIAYTDGGYEVTWFEYMSMFHSSGRSLPTKNLDQEMQRQIDYNYQIAKERFVEEYPEIVEELGEDNIDYNSLYEAGYGSEAEQLSEWEMDFDGNDTIMCEIGAYYYTPNNYRSLDGQHTIRLFGLVNLEAPYHRRGNLDDSHDIDITFNSIEELKEKVDAGLIEILNWFGGMYYESSDREMKIRKMETGGGIDKTFVGGNLSEWDLQSLNSGIRIKHLNEMLMKKFPDAFGLEIYEAKNPTQYRNLTPDIEPHGGIKNDDLKVYFDKYHSLHYSVYQGGENTYFNFALEGDDNKGYIGSFGFKDQGDVEDEYVTSFVVFLHKAYGQPFKVNHEVYGTGGGVGSIKVGDKVNLSEIKMPDGRTQFERVERGEVLYINDGIYGVKNPKTNRIHQVRHDQIESVIPKANLGMLLVANQLMQNRQQRLSDPNYRSKWEDRGLDYRNQQPMMYPQQPMQPMMQQQPMQPPMGQPMYAKGGSVGSEVTFKHWDGTTKTGTIVEIFPDGSMDVSCGFGHCLVNPSDVVGAEKMARGSKVSEYYGIKENNVITEKQMNLIKNRLNAGKKDAELEDIVQYIWDNAPDLTPDQNKKGHDFLMNLWKSPTGKERVNNPFGYREQEALEEFDHFSLAGFHDASRYGQAPYYIPLYDVWMKDGEYGFQYYYNGEVNIVGAKGMKVPSKAYRNNLSRMSKSELLDYCKKNNIPCASGWDKDQILDIIDDVHASRYGKGGSTAGWHRDRKYVDKGAKHEVRYAKSHSGRSGYKSNEEFGVGGGVRTNSKEVREKVRQHILDSVYDYEENQFSNFQDASQHLTDEFKRVADHPNNLKRFPNNQKRFQDYLQGIPFNFEFENYKIEEFLNGLGINPTGKEYNSDQMWHLYSYLIWREVEPTYQSKKFSGGGTTDEDDILEFTIPTWALSPLINADESGLEDEDIEKLNNFVSETSEQYGNANFMLGDKSEETEFAYSNDIDNLGGDVTTLYLRPSKEYGKGGSTAGWHRDRMFVNKAQGHEKSYSKGTGRSGYKDAKYGTGGSTGSKVFNEMSGIGSSKYVVNYHDGKKTHNDGSPFFDIAIFKNKIEKDRFINKLRADGYKEKSSYGTGGTTGSKFYVVDNRELTFGSSKPVVASFDTREEARADAKDRNKIYDADTKMFSVMTANQLKAEGVTEFGGGGSAGSKVINDLSREEAERLFALAHPKSKVGDRVWNNFKRTPVQLIYTQLEEKGVKFGTGGTTDKPKEPIAFETSNLYYNGKGRDVNGNKVVRVSFANGRAFSIQTNGVLPKTHKDGYDEKEINQYVKEYGSDAQKKKLKIY